MKEPLFLTLAEVIEIHNDQTERYGGSAAIRDLGLLQSAIAQPSASFSGQWLHGDIFMMAAAYAFHICGNHPFVDGNKRTALASALVFLRLNGIDCDDPKGKLLEAMLWAPKGGSTTEEFARILREL